MLKPPHPVARLAYSLAQWINPNNHALDGGRATSAMEKEAVAGIAEMFGWPEHLGHLCGGGTMANLEALWLRGNWRREKKFWQASKLITHMGESARFFNCRLRLCLAMRAGAWILRSCAKLLLAVTWHSGGLDGNYVHWVGGYAR